MTYSEILGFLSLAGYLALLGRAFWSASGKAKRDFTLADYGFENFSDVIRTALMVSPDQSVITMADLNSEYRVLFRAYNYPNGGSGLEFGFPSTQWTRPHLETLREELRNRGIRLEKGERSYGKFVTEAHVDCGKDIDKAAELARYCFRDLFGLGPNTRFRISPSNWPDREDIVIPDSNGNRSLAEYHKVMGSPPLKLTMTAAAYTVVLVLISYPALWWAWILADEQQPDWQWTFGSLHVAGSHATWVLLLIFGAVSAGYSKARVEIYKIVNPRPETRIQRIIDRTSSVLIVYALPLAVIAAWVGI